MQLIMMGTGDFAVPTFRRLLDQTYTVQLLVTQPDRPQGRHQKLTPAPIKEQAIEHGIEVFQPENVNTPEAIDRLRSLRPDLLVVAAYGQILSDSLLRLARHGGVNLHASLLPKYRGAAPINWAIYHGETVTGVSVIRVVSSVDAGAILLQAEIPIEPDETAGELEVRLAGLGAPLVCQAVAGLAAGTLKGRKQDRSKATRAPKLKKEDGLIDWSRASVAVCNQIRAMQPWPMPFTFWHRARGGPPERILVERAVPGDVRLAPATVFRAGTVAMVDEHNLRVWAGDGFVELRQLRPSGKRSMSVAEFLRGNPVRQSDWFGERQELTYR